MNNGEACYILVERGQENMISRGQRAPGLQGPRAMHGNISYEYFYRSRVDTPFSQQDFQQHIIRGAFRTDLLGKYPVNINMAYKASNSPYFRNTLEVDIGFDARSFRRQIEEQLASQARRELEGSLGVTALEGKYRKAVNDAAYWQRLYADPQFSAVRRVAAQELAVKVTDALREKDSTLDGGNAVAVLRDYLSGKKVPDLASAVGGMSAAAKDSAKSVLGKYEGEMKEFRELSQMGNDAATEAKKLYDKVLLLKKGVNDSITMLKGKLSGIRNGQELNKVMAEHGISKDSITRQQRRLMALRSLQVGRAMPDYTDLTVRNISLTGISASVSAGPYVSVAAGFLDYRYRDVGLKNTSLPRQAAAMARVGLSGYEDRGLFITAYTARREVNSPAGNAGREKYAAGGYSVQYIWRPGRGHSLSAEVAKSNAPAYRPGAGQAKKDGGLFDFGLRGNEAYEARYDGSIEATNTRVKASYKRMGADFQCLSGYSGSAAQTGYSVSADQSLFSRTLTLRAGIRRNESSYPYLRSISSNTVFKTAQLVFRKARWPSLVAGYYPTSQLVAMPDKEAAEVTYHTLSATASHQYRVMGVSNNTMLTWSRFYNSSSDSGFLYQDATYWDLQHFLWLAAFTVQAGYSVTARQALAVSSAGSTVSWAGRRGLQLTGGGRYSALTGAGLSWGGQMRAALPLRRLGTVSIQYDRSFLPAWERRELVPVTSGRVIYTKQF